MERYQEGPPSQGHHLHDGSGQMIPILALMIFVLSGMVALAVDIGHVYQQRQQLQNTAVSAAEAGAYETYGFAVNSTTFSDTQVKQVMISVVNNAGYSVLSMTSPGDPCALGYRSSQVYLQAEYLDAQNNPSVNVNGTSPVLVGSGVTTSQFASQPRGVKVLSLGSCVPGFFSPILGRKNFVAGGNAQAGLVYSNATNTGGPCGATACPSTLTATATATATRTATATGTATSSVPTNTPTADIVNTVVPPPGVASGVDAPFYIYGKPNGGNPMLFAQGSPSYSVGDTVTMFGSASDWGGDQYAGIADGKTGIPAGITLHDSSIIGCLDASLTPYIIGTILDTSTFNNGGVGHCTVPALHLAEVVMIPVVNTVCKIGNCNNGGWTVIIQGFVLVQLTLINPPGAGGNSGSGHVIQGTIVGVVSDPYGIVQPPPSPTPTPIPPTATIPPSSTPTITPIPPTATRTSVPVPATNTPIPVTATPTPLPPA